MGRRRPTIRGRGNVAPPVGYRPGLKARWLTPRPIHTRPEPDTMPFTLTVIDVDQDTPGLIDPANQGALIMPVAAGLFLEAHLLPLNQPDEPGSWKLVLDPDGNTGGPNVAAYDYNQNAQDPAQAIGEANPRSNSLAVLATALSRTAQAITPVGLYCAFYSDLTPPTSLAARIVIKTYA